jgi:uncharacterized protein (DUF433 family)
VGSFPEGSRFFHCVVSKGLLQQGWDSKTFAEPKADATVFSYVNYTQTITIEPGKRGGRPCIRHMRIAVSDVLGWLAAGMSHEEILSDYPELTNEDILACLSYVADRERRVLTAA